MRTRIESVGRARATARFRRASSIQLAADAAIAALDASGRDAADIDLLVNVGVYRDQNICEPALAPLIQRRIAPLAHRKDVFSFDLNNGTCGLINAFQVADAYLRTGSARRAMVLASDVDPNPRRSTGLALQASGVAVVVAAGDGREGFLGFHSETFSKHANLLESRLDWLGPRPRWIPGGAGHAIAMRTMEAYAERCAECSATSIAHFLENRSLGIDDIDLVLAADAPAGFVRRLTALCGLREGSVVSGEETAGAHTALPGLALESALKSGRLREARHTLFVTAGAGITVSLALYGS
jgi:3-oxoacyl-[acyl-carrier-protein] synthase-3